MPFDSVKELVFHPICSGVTECDSVGLTSWLVRMQSWIECQGSDQTAGRSAPQDWSAWRPHLHGRRAEGGTTGRETARATSSGLDS